ncbi:hypothetical protein C8Q75DRAFT_803883 [Abortiporus biennis]|nr:hypothetical protein C8Q75DRAFT_803883 [Abortiporus biennis]
MAIMGIFFHRHRYNASTSASSSYSTSTPSSSNQATRDADDLAPSDPPTYDEAVRTPSAPAYSLSPSSIYYVQPVPPPRHTPRDSKADSTSSATGNGSRSGSSSSVHTPEMTYDQSKLAEKALKREEEIKAILSDERTEHSLRILASYDIVIIVDDSTSMRKCNRWFEACDALSALVGVAVTKSEGVDIHFVNSSEKRTVTSAAEVEDIFRTVQPCGGTPLGRKMSELVGEYMDRIKKATKNGGSADGLKKVIYLIITDGEPTDDPCETISDVKAFLGDYGLSHASQMSFQFVQIGNDPEGTKYLKELDGDDTMNEALDIVDTEPYDGAPLTAEKIIKIMKGGIDRRVDRVASTTKRFK